MTMRGALMRLGAAAVVVTALSSTPPVAHAATGFTCATTPSGCPPPSFDAPPLAAIGAPGVEQSGVYSLAQGDFDGNGTTDFAAVAEGGAVQGVTAATGVLVFLGRGDGTFAAPIDYPAGKYPIQVITGRLRGPNAPLDLVVVDAGQDATGNETLAVLLGNGDGTFQPPRLISFSALGSAALGDFNGDGKLDLAVSTQTVPSSTSPVPQEITILLGNGDGTFQPPASYTAGNGLSPDWTMQVADFNHDGKLDILGLNSEGLWLSLGNGDGTFMPAAEVWVDPTGGSPNGATSGPSSFAVGDLNGDGVPDVALDIGGGRVDVLLNSGAGVLAPAGEYQTDQHQENGFGGGTIQAADLNGDGRLDLVVATGFGATLVELSNTGNGTFGSPAVYPLAHTFDGNMVITQLAGDTLPDIVVASGWGGIVGDVNFLTVLRNRGDGSFTAPQQFAVVSPANNQTANPTNPVGVTLGDFNGDGKLDLAVTEYDYPVEPLVNGQIPTPPTVNPGAGTVDTGGSVAVLLGNGDGTFGSEKQYFVGGRPVDVEAKDLTGDGHLDLVVANAFSNTLSLLKGKGDGTFQAAVTIPVGTGPVALAIGDFNGDGRPDIAVTTAGDGTVSALLNQSTPGHLAFGAAAAYPVAPSPDAMVAGDFTGDGRLDLAVAGYGSISPNSPSTLTILASNGDGTFHALPSQTLWASSYQGAGADAIVAGDFSRDGTQDLAVANFLRGEVDVLHRQADGTFAPIGAYIVGEGPESIVVADFNGDGLPDLAVGDLNDGTVTMLTGRGDGTFTKAADRSQALPVPFGWPVFPFPTFLASGDLTGDGRPDIVAPNFFEAAVTVLKNTTPEASTPPIPESPAPALFGATGLVAIAVSRRRRRGG